MLKQSERTLMQRKSRINEREYLFVVDSISFSGKNVFQIIQEKALSCTSKWTSKIKRLVIKNFRHQFHILRIP